MQVYQLEKDYNENYKKLMVKNLMAYKKHAKAVLRLFLKEQLEELKKKR